ncbi:MAG: trigger factor [Candidatus Absconditabacterales bacterium]
MEKKITKSNQSNYEIEIVVTPEEKETAKLKILKDFQKNLELPGFRKGFVPLDAVEKNVQAEYITVGVFENIINAGLQQIIKETPDLKLIGEPYDIDQKEKDSKTILTMKLDVFPEVIVSNSDWEKEHFDEIDNNPTKEEIDNAMTSLKKNYADYKDTDLIKEDTISKLSIEYLAKDGAVLDKGHTYVGEQEFAESKFYKENFIDKKKGDIIDIEYKVKSLPASLQNKKADIEPKTIRLVVQDVKQIILPEMKEETLKKLFGEDTKLKNENDLLQYIKESIQHQKFEMTLIKKVEDYLKKIKGKNMDIVIPKTLIEEEYKVRIKNLETRFGSEEKMSQYFKKIGDEQSKIFLDDIKKAATESLEKFFILQKVSELLKLDINREKTGHLEIEKKLYEKLLHKSSVK